MELKESSTGNRPKSNAEERIQYMELKELLYPLSASFKPLINHVNPVHGIEKRGYTQNYTWEATYASNYHGIKRKKECRGRVSC